MRSSTMQTLNLAPPAPAHGGDGGRLGPAGASAMAPLALLHPAAAPETRLTRLLVNVTVDPSLWPVHVVMDADSTVADLTRAAVAAYVREGRRPPIPPGEEGAAAGFELHLSKYSLEVLNPEEKVMDLGSRNFFLCARRSAP